MSCKICEIKPNTQVTLQNTQEGLTNITQTPNNQVCLFFTTKTQTLKHF